MKEIILKIGNLVQPIIDEKGGISFFALVLREEASVWDILVAAKWIDQDRKEALAYLVKQVQRVLTKQELLKISGIILLQSEHYDGQQIMRSPSPMSWVESNIDLYNVAVKHAYIFVSTDGYFNPQNAISSDRMPTDSYIITESSPL